MKLRVPKIVNKLLSNTIVLYIVMIVSLTNLIGYISLNDTTSVLLFLITGLVTSYYTGNMTLILLSPIIVTNLFYVIYGQTNIRETMVERMENKTDNNSKNKVKNSSKNKKNGTNASKKDTHKKPTDKDDDLEINQAATYESFFEGLGNNVNSTSLEKMTNQTKKLIESQVKLKEAMGQLTPMVDSAKTLMKNLGDMGKLTGFEGFNSKNMNASIKKIMNQFMNTDDGTSDNENE